MKPNAIFLPHFHGVDISIPEHALRAIVKTVEDHGLGATEVLVEITEKVLGAGHLSATMMDWPESPMHLHLGKVLDELLDEIVDGVIDPSFPVLLPVEMNLAG